MLEKHIFLYKTTNLLDGMIYIGLHETKIIEDGYLGSGTRLKKAVAKHGKENFSKEILFFCNSREGALKLEKLFVTPEFVARKDTYNLAVGGWGWLEVTEATRRKKAAISRTKRHTEETKRKIGDAHRGKVVSDEARKNMSEGAKGKVFSQEARKNMSKGQQGRRHPEEIKKKISEALRGKAKTPEHIENNAAARRGKKKTGQALENNRAGAKKRSTSISLEKQKKMQAGFRMWMENKKSGGTGVPPDCPDGSEPQN